MVIKARKVCLLCEHFNFTGKQRGYSEYTPGYDASMNCTKGKWYAEELGLLTEKQFYKYMHMAEKCKLFRKRKTDG